MQSRYIYTIIFLLFPLILSAHGVNYTVMTGGIGIEVKYSDGKPMSYCETKIYSPSTPDEVFQQGYTDPNGRFIFSPDKEGTWIIVVNDGMGHGIIAEVPVNKDFHLQIIQDKYLPLWQKIISGTGIIGLIFTILYIIFLKRRKNAYSGRIS